MSAIRKIIVVGDSYTAYQTALILGLNIKNIEIVIIDGVNAAHNSVAESSGPSIHVTLDLLKIDLAEFAERTEATVKFANRFLNWNVENQDFFQSLSAHGARLGNWDFIQSICELYHLGYEPNIEDFSLAATAARAGRFDCTLNSSSMATGLHFDLNMFKSELRKRVVALGCKLVAEEISKVVIAENGYIDCLISESGVIYRGDFYIDCTDKNALLIGQAMQVGFQDWTTFFKANRVLFARSKSSGSSRSLATVLRATQFGFVRSIPLLNEDVHEYYYSDGTPAHIAQQDFAKTLGTPGLEMHGVDISVGRRDHFWEKNCIAIGGSAVNMEGGIYTSAFISVAAVTKLLDYFPSKNLNQLLIDEYNRVVGNEINHIRDYHALLYFLLPPGHPLKLRKEMVPPRLEYKMKLFNSSCRLPWFDDEVVERHQWESLLLGMGVWPDRRDPLLSESAIPELISAFNDMRRFIKHSVSKLPKYE